MGQRITRKQLKQDDEFVSTAELIFRWLAGNIRPLLAGVGAVCAAALIWWGASAWLGTRADEASLLLNKAVTTFEGAGGEGAIAPEGDLEAAEAEFREVVERYGRSDQADMARLFLDRRAGWKAIYRSIQAISDGVAAKQRLDEVEFARIQEWIESGAANLFSIQRDLARAIARLGRQVAAIDAQIARCSAALDLSSRRRRADDGLRNVVSLDTWRQGRQVAELERQRLDLLEQIKAKQGVKDLIDADVRDLENCLRATRRAYFIRLA